MINVLSDWVIATAMQDPPWFGRRASPVPDRGERFATEPTATSRSPIASDICLKMPASLRRTNCVSRSPSPTGLPATLSKPWIS